MVFPFGPRVKIGIGVVALAAGVMVWQTPSAPRPLPETPRQDAQAAVGVLPVLPEASRGRHHSRKKALPTPPLVVAPSTPAAPARPIPPYVELGAMTSRPGEAKEDFLVRLAQSMDLFTRSTGHETCGMIMESDTGGTYKVRLTSNRAHISCTMMSFREPGFHAIGEDIHSHPRIVGGVKSNGPDVKSRSDLHCGGRIIIYDETFSDVDFRNGPGYLVSRGRLLFQHGAQWPMRQVATIEAIQESEPLQVGGLDASGDEQLASAAWGNQEVEGLPSTQCPEALVAKNMPATQTPVKKDAPIVSTGPR